MKNKLKNLGTNVVKAIADGFTSGAKVAITLGVAALLEKNGKRILQSINDSFTVIDYGDVIRVVVDSDMVSSGKRELIDAIPKDGDVALYKSIIAIIRSDMLTSSKVNAIKNLCKQVKGEEA